jgi:hypothetical protein
MTAENPHGELGLAKPVRERSGFRQPLERAQRMAAIGPREKGNDYLVEPVAGQA